MCLANTFKGFLVCLLFEESVHVQPIWCQAAAEFMWLQKQPSSPVKARHWNSLTSGKSASLTEKKKKSQTKASLASLQPWVNQRWNAVFFFFNVHFYSWQWLDFISVSKGNLQITSLCQYHFSPYPLILNINSLLSSIFAETKRSIMPLSFSLC